MEKTEWELVKEISTAYVLRMNPSQANILSEYLTIIELDDSGEENIPGLAKRFGPSEILSNIVVPMIVGIITNYLYDLLKNKLSGNKKVNLQVLKNLKSDRVSIEKKLSKKINNKKLIRDVLDYVEEYIRNIDVEKS